MAEEDEGLRDMTFPDSEEVFAELLEKYASRKHLALHRAVVRGDTAEITRLVDADGVPVDATLLPIEGLAAVLHVHETGADDLEGLVRHDNDPWDFQHLHGAENEQPNELFPSGSYDEPETDLDACFQSPLTRACSAGVSEVVELLIALGADKAARSPCGVTPLLAALRGPGETAERAALVTAVACEATIKPSAEIMARPEDDGTRMATWPLLVAAMDEDCTTDGVLLQALIDAGCPLPPELAREDIRDWMPAEAADVLLQAAAAVH